VARRQILRNTNGQTNVFYVDVDTTDLTTDTFLSLRTDSELQSQEPVALFDAESNSLLDRYGMPPNDKAVLASHLDRMFLAGEEVYSQGCIVTTFGSKEVVGIGTEWPASLAGRYLYVEGADRYYEIDAVDTSTQTITLTSEYASPGSAFAVYGIRPPPAQRRSVAYSEAGLPQAWPAVNSITIQEDDSGAITGLMPKDSFLYILCQRRVYRFTFQENPIKDGYVFPSIGRGCINNRCWVVVGEDAYLMDDAGIYAFTGDGQVKRISELIQDLFEAQRLRMPSYRVQWSASRWFHACYDPGLNAIRWFVTLSGKGIPRHALCFDLDGGRWWVEEYPFPVGASCVGVYDGERRVFLGGPGGKVYLHGQGTLDQVDHTKGTVYGTVTSASIQSLTDSRARFASDLVNASISIVQGRGKGQVRKIVSASSSTVRVDSPFLIKPDATSTYQIGGIRWRYRTGWLRHVPSENSTPRRLMIEFEPLGVPTTLNIRQYIDRAKVPTVWNFHVSSSEASGLASERDSADLVGDLTKANGRLARRLDSRKENYLDAPTLISWEMDGVTNSDEFYLYQIQIDGVEGR